MPKLVATPSWTQLNLAVPLVGLIRHPRDQVLDVAQEGADWLIENGYAELVEPDLESEKQESPPPPTGESGESDTGDDANDSHDQGESDDQKALNELVLEFCNESPLDDLIAVKGITPTVAKSLFEARPLTWEKLDSLVTDRQLTSLQKHLSS